MKTISKQVCGGSQKRLKKWWIEVSDNNFETYHEANTIRTSMILYDVIWLILNPVTFVLVLQTWDWMMTIEWCWWPIHNPALQKFPRKCWKICPFLQNSCVFYLRKIAHFEKEKSEFGRKLPVLRIPLSGFLSVWALICYW